MTTIVTRGELIKNGLPMRFGSKSKIKYLLDYINKITAQLKFGQLKMHPGKG